MNNSKPGNAKAIVTRGPLSERQWRLENVRHRPIKDDEVLVKIIASGICLADVHFGDVPMTELGGNPALYYPRVLGHEGCGYVEEVGSKVTSVKIHDPVLLSFASCGSCYACIDSHPAYCAAAFELNFLAENDIYSSVDSTDFNIGGSFFGQSSFASKAVARECSVINLQGVVDGEEELKFLAPMGCGIQTGSAAIINVAGVMEGQDVAVIGVGGVGLSAIMASKMKKCDKIIAIDRTESRLELALTLGATHTINTSNPSLDLVAEILKITNGSGVHASLDTTGVFSLARQSYDFVRNRGKVLQVGLAKPDDKWDIPMADLMNSGKQILGCVQGDVIPRNYSLEMIKWYREGKLPVDKLIRFYDAAHFEKALADMRSGDCVKPVLLWPSTPTGKEKGVFPHL